MVARQAPRRAEAQQASNALMSLLREGGQWDETDDLRAGMTNPGMGMGLRLSGQPASAVEGEEKDEWDLERARITALENFTSPFGAYHFESSDERRVVVGLADSQRCASTKRRRCRLRSGSAWRGRCRMTVIFSSNTSSLVSLVLAQGGACRCRPPSLGDRSSRFATSRTQIVSLTKDPSLHPITHFFCFCTFVMMR